MADLTTQYLGLELATPLIVSSSGLTSSVRGVERAFRAGAGAVVLKSLFEEQIDVEIRGERETDELSVHPEAGDYLQRMGKQLGPSAYLGLVRDAKRSATGPLIASVNCISSRWWSEWTRQIEDAGADAIELNIAIMPRGIEQTSEEIEGAFLRIIDRVRQAVRLPLSVKLGPYFTALPRFAARLERSGVSGLVLFNRFYQPDIDVESLELVPAYQFSAHEELYPTLRWTSILSGQIACDIAASTGVESGTDVVKLLLAGANAVQVCSVLYRKGYEHLGELAGELAGWMDRKGYASVEDFRGKLVQSASAEPEAYERLQYIQALTGLS